MSDTCLNFPDDAAQIVHLILRNDPRGGELLYKRYARGLSFLAQRHSPEHAEDCLQDTLLSVIEQIRAGKLLEPAALPGYLATVLKRTAWNKNVEWRKRAGDQETFDLIVTTKADEQDDPCRQLEIKERTRLMRDGLLQLKSKEREILTRFYLQEQTPEAICAAMKLTQTQFRLLKCRSKQLLEKCIAKSTDQTVLKGELAFSTAVN